MEGSDDDIDALTERFRVLGAQDPRGWASSQVSEGIPQLGRFLFLRHAWRGVVDVTDTSWIEGNIVAARNDPTAPFSGIGAALARLRASGASDEDIGEVVRGMQAVLLFHMCSVIDDPGEFEAEAGDMGWALVQVNQEGEVIGQLSGLHESVLGTDPTGREMRPGAPDA